MDAESSGTSAANAGKTLTDAAREAGWPTPRANESPNVSALEIERIASGERTASSTGNSRLELTAALAGWPTPTAKTRAGGATTDPDKVLARARGGHSNDLQDFVQLAAGWPTPKAEDAESTGFSAKRLAAGKQPDNLHSATKLLTGWATPNHRDYRTPAHKSYRERGGGKKGENLNHQVAQQIPGASLNGLNAATGNGGLLNPAFSRWLLGVPETWLSCGPSGTRSARKSRRRSSKPG